MGEKGNYTMFKWLEGTDVIGRFFVFVFVCLFLKVNGTGLQLRKTVFPGW